LRSHNAGSCTATDRHSHRHSDLGEVRSDQADRMRRQSRRSGQAPMGGGLLPPVIATAVGARGRLRDRQRRPTRLGRTPIEGATPELEPVDRDAILG
jgi:hypothetical protein